LRACLKLFLLPQLLLGLIVVTAGCAKMEQIIDQLASLRGTNTENERVWIRKDLDRDKLIVFVHGFNSSNDTARGQFPSLLKDDDHLKDCNIVKFGYRTKFCSSVDSFHVVGQHLASFLHEIFESKSPNYHRIVMVGHSMGGLATVYALLHLELKHFKILTVQDLRL
jgi:esterase/lipase superfamily enzyme